MIPTVAIVGRPNVGKSTLFNALLGERKAIVSDISGTTRDNVIARINPSDQFGDSENLIPYLLVDTAGLTNAKGETLEHEVVMQALTALESADVILWVLDGKQALTLDDQDILDKLRRKTQRVMVLANKLDDGQNDKVLEWMGLGLGEVLAVSGKNFFGIWDLQDALQEKFKTLGWLPPEASTIDLASSPDDDLSSDIDKVLPSSINVAIVGRPNVGKSSLFNQILGKNRSVVSNVSGTTRDAIDEDFIDQEGQAFRFVDCAGLRRPGKIGYQNIEYWSKVRGAQAVERADICVLLLDALEGVTHQDLAIVKTILEAGKGLILAINKFDLVREKTKEQETDERELDEIPMWGEDLDKVRHRYMHYLKQKIEFLPWAPVLFFSAKTGRGIKDLFPSLKAIAQERNKRIPTAELNRFVPEVYHAHVIPTKGAKTGKLKYASQVATHPPKFIFFVNNTEVFHFSYKRYLENRLREKYGFEGTPIVVEFRDARREDRA